MGRAQGEPLIGLPVVLHPRHPPGVAEALAGIAGITLLRPEDDAATIAALESAPVLVTFRWEPSFLAPGLRWVQSISTGYEQFPLELLVARGVALTSARGVHGPQVAEHAFALLLAMTRGVGISMREAAGRVWRPRVGEELGGRTMAVLGLGAVGEEIARRATAWGMHVIGTKAHPAGYEGAASEVAGPEATVEVCRRAEIAICVLPASPETDGLVGSEALAALGSGWLVNVGRGSTVDLAAVLEALDHGELRGAGLDVFPEEPLPEDSPVWAHPRVVITPHTAGLSPAYGPRLADVFRANLAGFTGRGSWATRVV